MRLQRMNEQIVKKDEYFNTKNRGATNDKFCGRKYAKIRQFRNQLIITRLQKPL